VEKVEIKLESSTGRQQYKILIGETLLSAIGLLLDLEAYSRFFVVSAAKLADRYYADIRDSLSSLGFKVDLILIEDGEENKQLATVEKIWQQLLEHGADRKALVFNLGGGMLGDLAGFAASTYMRGIDFVQCPTTLLAQVDASVGGKVGINFAGVKNIIGSFQQPLAVVIDLDTLASLPEREFRSGLAEVIKHGLIFDAEYFSWLEARDLQHLSSRDLTHLVRRSVEIKSEIVAADEREGGIRKLLNFGHTAGHAIESMSFSSKARMLHGEAVALGMLVESKISLERGLLSAAEFTRLESLLKKVGFELKLPEKISLDVFFDYMRKDKKSEAGQVNWTLIAGIGKGIIDQRVSDDEVRSAINCII
jgi:3-dehydroquinate synthase